MFKYKIMSLILFLLCLSSFSFVDAKYKDNMILLNKIIYIDPGHGGVDPGAMYKNIKEKDINLEISKKIQEVLEESGAIVYLTRYGDYDLSVPNTINRKRSDLSRRGNIINKSKCDMFLSVHLNSESSSTWYGAQVFYNDVNKKNEQLAKIIQKNFQNDLNSKRKYKKDQTLYLQKRIDQPGVLLELGFLSNPNDRYLLRQKYYQNKIACLLKKSMIEYFTY